uniref:Uncharacterized protein n=1 Tax=Rhizophora mucronata TaxID=61149 RepID=A0A2P2R1H4_RHIMU
MYLDFPFARLVSVDFFFPCWSLTYVKINV